MAGILIGAALEADNWQRNATHLDGDNTNCTMERPDVTVMAFAKRTDDQEVLAVVVNRELLLPQSQQSLSPDMEIRYRRHR